MARQIFDLSGNDSFASATNIGGVLDDPFVQGGVLGNDDKFDTYKFSVTTPTRFNVSLLSKTADSNVSLFDENGQQLKFSGFPGTGTSSLDTFGSKNLTPGNYFIQVSTGIGSGGRTYDLSMTADPITSARMSIKVNRIKALDDFETFGDDSNIFSDADFYFNRVSIDKRGRPAATLAQRSSAPFDNQNDIRPNFQVSTSVDPNLRDIGGSIFVQEADADFDDFVDLSPSPLNDTVRFLLDVRTGDIRADELIQNDGRFLGIDDFDIRSQGDGKTRDFSKDFSDGGTKNLARASIEYRASYETFTSSSATSLNSAPFIAGTNRSQTITGQSADGIIDGKNGRDTLYGMGGDDILVGGNGNDSLHGDTGNDILFGGLGRDTLEGGRGKDTFVLAPNTGVDVITDYRSQMDKIGLTSGIVFEVLNITQRGENAIISLGEQRLAVLKDVAANSLTAANFVQVDFATVNTSTIPYLVA